MNDNKIIPEVTLTFIEDKLGRRFLSYDDISDYMNVPTLHVKVVNTDGKESVYPVFQQNAMQYGEYSQYMKMHGCACCSLTTVLVGLRRSKSGYMPQDTIAQVEKKHFPHHEFNKNYNKPLRFQMPVSLYGISKILEKEGISNHYVGHYKEKEAMEVIERHLHTGNPIIFETSRVRHKNRLIYRINDKKYAGSYHTMVMLGIDLEGMVVFTDSATRAWAGDQQRLKRAPLDELITYMFPQKITEDTHVYFHRRRETGGFILVQAWKKEGFPK